MAESTNALDRDALKVEVADFLGYTRTEANWDTNQVARIEACVDAGVRQFYAPPILPEADHAGDPAHEWTFIKIPYHTDTVAADWDVDCPDDFGSQGDPWTYDPTEGSHLIEHVAPWQILKARMAGSASGRPSMFAVRWKANTGLTGQRAEWLFYPTPGGAYTINCTYYILQGKLTDALAYHLGGAAHSSTVLASCMERAAFRYREAQHERMLSDFRDRLRSSIAHDNRFGWDTLGRNTDGSDVPRFSRRWNASTLDGNAVT